MTSPRQLGTKNVSCFALRRTLHAPLVKSVGPEAHKRICLARLRASHRHEDIHTELTERGDLEY